MKRLIANLLTNLASRIHSNHTDEYCIVDEYDIVRFRLTVLSDDFVHHADVLAERLPAGWILMETHDIRRPYAD